MAKTPSKGSKRLVRPKPPVPPRVKIFRPMGWNGTTWSRSAGDYVSHMLLELGRLGLAIGDIENSGGSSGPGVVLSELLDWMSTQPSAAYANLCDWGHLDLGRLRKRAQENRQAKPRIEISATITKKYNLSVRWHPTGWKESEFNWFRKGGNEYNQIELRKWPELPDFRWFIGDEVASFDSRPSNELMFIRGVGNLDPTPREVYYGSYNRDVVDSILICAVRAAYESFIRQLKHSFEVKLVNAFDFETRDEIDEGKPLLSRFPVKRVVSWVLDDAEQLTARREHRAAEARERLDRAEFDNLTEAFGFSLEDIAGAISRGSAPKSNGVTPTVEIIDRNAAKELRNAGFKIDAGQVRRIRTLAERYRPDILPEALKLQTPLPEARITPSSSNAVNFPEQAD